MHPLLKKLQWKGEGRLYVRAAPPEFRPTLEAWRAEAELGSSPRCRKLDGLMLFFVKSAADIERFAPQAETKAGEDGLLWFAYPKKSSRRYRTDISRDTGWQPLGDLGFEGVRQVAIDEDWSALRFRRAERIAKMTRGFAMSRAGKARTRSPKVS